jgi:LCP family protein required for cell wall assembly
VNPAKHAASILGFPRDSFVPIPGHGTQKINSALTFGGPKLAAKTIENLTGIHIDYYLITSFRGLRNMVDAVGGIKVKVLVPMHDQFSHADFNPGVHHFDGAQALAFARDRHDFSNGDLTRSANQGRLFLAGLAEFRRQFNRDPGTVLTWMGAGLRNVQSNLSLDEMLKLAFTAQQVRATNVKNAVVPGHGAVVGGADVVVIDSGAKSMYADMRKDGLLNGK